MIKIKKKTTLIILLTILALLVVSVCLALLSPRGATSATAGATVFFGDTYVVEGREVLESPILTANTYQADIRTASFNGTTYRNDNLTYRIVNERISFERDSYITQIIPRRLFEEVGTHFHIGVNYGFYIETFRDSNTSTNPILRTTYSNVMLFSIDNGIGSGEQVGNINFRVTVLLTETFALFNNSVHSTFNHNLTATGSQKFPSWNVGSSETIVARVNRAYWDRYLHFPHQRFINHTTNLALMDVDYALAMANATEKNHGDYGYEPLADTGHFVSGVRVDVNNEGFRAEHSNAQARAEALRGGIGLLVGAVVSLITLPLKPALAAGAAVAQIIGEVGYFASGGVQSGELNDGVSMVFAGDNEGDNPSLSTMRTMQQVHNEGQGLPSLTRAVNGRVRGAELLLTATDSAAFTVNTSRAMDEFAPSTMFQYGVGLRVVEYGFTDWASNLYYTHLAVKERAFTTVRGPNVARNTKDFAEPDYSTPKWTSLNSVHTGSEWHLAQNIFYTNGELAHRNHQFVRFTPRRTGTHFFDLHGTSGQEMEVFKLTSALKDTAQGYVRLFRDAVGDTAGGFPYGGEFSSIFWHGGVCEVLGNFNREGLGLSRGRVQLVAGVDYVFKVRFSEVEDSGDFRLGVREEQELDFGTVNRFEIFSQESLRFYFDVETANLINFNFNVNVRINDQPIDVYDPLGFHHYVFNGNRKNMATTFGVFAFSQSRYYLEFHALVDLQGGSGELEINLVRSADISTPNFMPTRTGTHSFYIEQEHGGVHSFTHSNPDTLIVVLNNDFDTVAHGVGEVRFLSSSNTRYFMVTNFESTSETLTNNSVPSTLNLGSQNVSVTGSSRQFSFTPNLSGNFAFTSNAYHFYIVGLGAATPLATLQAGTTYTITVTPKNSHFQHSFGSVTIEYIEPTTLTANQMLSTTAGQVFAIEGSVVAPPLYPLPRRGIDFSLFASNEFSIYDENLNLLFTGTQYNRLYHLDNIDRFFVRFGGGEVLLSTSRISAEATRVSEGGDFFVFNADGRSLYRVEGKAVRVLDSSLALVGEFSDGQNFNLVAGTYILQTLSNGQFWLRREVLTLRANNNNNSMHETHQGQQVLLNTSIAGVEFSIIQGSEFAEVIGGVLVINSSVGVSNARVSVIATLGNLQSNVLNFNVFIPVEEITIERDCSGFVQPGDVIRVTASVNPSPSSGIVQFRIVEGREHVSWTANNSFRVHPNARQDGAEIVLEAFSNNGGRTGEVVSNRISVIVSVMPTEVSFSVTSGRDLFELGESVSFAAGVNMGLAGHNYELDIVSGSEFIEALDQGNLSFTIVNSTTAFNPTIVVRAALIGVSLERLYSREIEISIFIDALDFSLLLFRDGLVFNSTDFVFSGDMLFTEALFYPLNASNKIDSISLSVGAFASVTNGVISILPLGNVTQAPTFTITASVVTASGQLLTDSITVGIYVPVTSISVANSVVQRGSEVFIQPIINDGGFATNPNFSLQLVNNAFDGVWLDSNASRLTIPLNTPSNTVTTLRAVSESNPQIFVAFSKTVEALTNNFSIHFGTDLWSGQNGNRPIQVSQTSPQLRRGSTVALSVRYNGLPIEGFGESFDFFLGNSGTSRSISGVAQLGGLNNITTLANASGSFVIRAVIPNGGVQRVVSRSISVFVQHVPNLVNTVISSNSTPLATAANSSVESVGFTTTTTGYSINGNNLVVSAGAISDPTVTIIHTQRFNGALVSFSRAVTLTRRQITLNLNGGEGGQRSVFTANALSDRVSRPTRQCNDPISLHLQTVFGAARGYNFLGFYNSASGGRRYYNEHGVRQHSIEDRTTELFARWGAARHLEKALVDTVGGGTSWQWWYFDINNPNQFPVFVRYNQRRSYHGDARYFRTTGGNSLAHIETVNIPALGTARIAIRNTVVGANWVTSSFAAVSSLSRSLPNLITYGNNLNSSRSDFHLFAANRRYNTVNLLT